MLAIAIVRRIPLPRRLDARRARAAGRAWLRRPGVLVLHRAYAGAGGLVRAAPVPASGAGRAAGGGVPPRAADRREARGTRAGARRHRADDRAGAFGPVDGRCRAAPGIATGIAFAIAAAVFYSLYIVVGAWLGRRVAAFPMSTIVIASAAAVFIVASLAPRARNGRRLRPAGSRCSRSRSCRPSPRSRSISRVCERIGPDARVDALHARAPRHGDARRASCWASALRRCRWRAAR